MAKAFAMHDFMASLPVAPAAVDKTFGITRWGVMLNDSLGDCTCATTGHMIQTWTAEAGAEVTVPDSAILTAYEEACGYDPSDPNTDQGGIISNVLDYFRDTGVGGHKIAAHAEVNITQMRVQQGVYIFDALDFGIELPRTAQQQIGPDKVWDIVNFAQSYEAQRGSWGGHSVPVVKYDPTGVWCVTWGALQKMTWQFLMYYADEAHACISPDDKQYPVPVEQLVSDLRQVGS